MEKEKLSLPADFDGVFRFTNASDEDFTAKWNGVEYTFPAMKTSPMIIPGATLDEIQHIRKKFAKEWGTKVFYNGDKFKALNAHTPGGVPATYTDADIAPYVQKCLEPLPLAKVVISQPKKRDVELAKDQKGRPFTKVVEQGESLLKDGASDLE